MFVKLKEVYEQLPEPAKTEHTWRYSEYSFFVKDQKPNTSLEVILKGGEILKQDIFESITLRYPEKITVYNLLNHQEKFSIHITRDGDYYLEQNFQGEYNIVRSQIKIDSNLEVDMIIKSSDKFENSVNNNVMEIEISQNSKVRIFFDNYFTKSYTHNFIYLNLADNSNVALVFSSFNSKYEKTHIRSVIDGIDSNYTVYILAKLNNNNHIDYRTENIHLKSGSKSLSVYRSIVDDMARSIYTGMLRIEKDAKYCNAYQNSRNILLSDKAKVETIPELEILNQEVACTHGAVVSSLDEEAIYYFMSRGVNRQEAIKLITDGFLLDKLEETFGTKLYSTIYKKVTGEEYS